MESSTNPIKKFEQTFVKEKTTRERELVKQFSKDIKYLEDKKYPNLYKERLKNRLFIGKIQCSIFLEKMITLQNAQKY